jgi:hypothetical protein
MEMRADTFGLNLFESCGEVITYERRHPARDTNFTLRKEVPPFVVG